MQLTVGVPVTRTKYLLETLRSIAAQTIPVAEVIVVNNFADGDVVAIIAQVDLPVRLITREKRLPPIENWNSLLADVKTDWFVLLSDDDYFAPDHVEQLTRVHARYPESRVLHTRVRMVDQFGVALNLSPLAPEYESALDFLWHRSAGFRIQFLSDFAWHSTSLRAAGGFADLPSAWGSDDLTVFRVAQKGGLAYGYAATFNYRMHPNSISSSYSVEEKFWAIECLLNTYRDDLKTIAVAEGDTGVLISSIYDILPSFKRRSQRYILASLPWYIQIKLALLGRLGRKPYSISLITLLRTLVAKAW